MRKFSLQWFKGSYSPAEASTSNQDGKSYSRYEHNTDQHNKGSAQHACRSYIHGRHHTTLPEGGVSDICVQDEPHTYFNITRPEDSLATIEGTGEVTWVIKGHSAPLGSQELSVISGQQVELLDSVTSGPDWCMVRLYSPGCAGIYSPSQEGLVPSSCLKPTPSMRSSTNTTSTENEDATVAAGEAASGSSTYSLPPNVSPASKHRGPFRKWLSNPVRKLSHGRLDRASSDNTKPATKKSSAPHHWKLLKEEMGNKPASSGVVIKQPDEQDTEKSSPLKPWLTQKSKSLDLNGGESTEEVCDVELPPPMKIQDHTFTPVSPPPPLASEGGGNKILLNHPLQTTESTNSADLASEIEQIVKERMEHHFEYNTDSSEIAQAKTSDVTSLLPPLLESKPELRSLSLSSQEETESPRPVFSGSLTSECDDKEKALQKRKYVIEELIDTEEDYVKDLGSIVEGYIAIMKSGEIPVPEDLKNGKDKIVFGNIEALYEWHRDTFFGELQKCAAEPGRLGPLFRRYERRLHMYVLYCQNKPKSEYIVSEFVDTYFEEVKQKLGHKLQLPDLLIKPIQRVMKYQLLLKDILKYTEKVGLLKEGEDLRKAVHIMHVVPKAANDMMNVGRLQGFDGKITAQGKLLLQGTLFVGEPLSGGKMKERQVFLFEQIIIFSESVGQKSQFSNPVYIYKNHLQVNKMSLGEKVDDEDNLKFVLKSKDPNQQGLCFVIQGTSQEERDEWVANIQAILDTQLDFLRALQSPIAYQKELTKDISAPELGSLWNPILRKTLSHPPTSHKFSKGSNSEGVSTKSLRQPGREKKSRSREVTPTEPRRIIVSGASGDVSQDTVSVAPIPVSPPSSAIPIEGKQGLIWLESQCMHSFPLEKHSNIPQQSPPKGKRNFFEEFCNTLRPKSKSDLMASSVVTSSLCTSQSLDSATSSHSCEPKTESDPKKDSGVNRRWSETSSYVGLPSPTLMQAIIDFDGVNEGEISLTKGDTVQLLATDPQQNRFHVQKTTADSFSPYDGWVPVNVLTQVKEGGRKHWSFKFRKPSFKSDKKEKERRSLDESLIRTTQNFPDSSLSTPKTEDAPFLSADTSFHFSECLNNLVVPEGATAVLTCRVVPFKQIKINWLLPDGSEIIKIHTDHSQRNKDIFMGGQRSPSPSGHNISFPLEERFSSPEGSSPSPEGSMWPSDGAPLKERVTATYDNDGYCTVIVNRCVLSDSGEYTCLVTANHHIASTTALLTVLGKPSPPGKPYVVELNGNTVCLQWSPPLYSGNSPLVAYTLEYSHSDSIVWNVAIVYAPNCSQVLENLNEGQLYLFRVTANNEVGISDPGQQSDPVYIPMSEPKGNYVIPRKDSRVRWKEDFHKIYDELEELGRGRFAVVKKCVHKLSGSQIVAKFISKKRQDPETVEKELLMLRDLHHHQLVPALDTYYTLQHFVLLLHLIQGPQLFEYICDKTSYDETTVCMFMRQLVEVVRYLHQKVIVHLDIKPENLMVDTQQLSPCLKLIDFGDAHILDSCSKYFHTLLGNPEFAAPEVISGQPVSHYTDIWSLGVVLYVFLSGVSPFMEEGDEETCSNILRNDFSFPNHYFAHVTREARHLISQLLIKEPHRRLSSEEILQNVWLRQGGYRSPNQVLSTARLSTFVERRRHVQHSIRNIQAPGDVFGHFHSNASSRS